MCIRDRPIIDVIIIVPFNILLLTLVYIIITIWIKIKNDKTIKIPVNIKYGKFISARLLIFKTYTNNLYPIICLLYTSRCV